MLVKLIAFNWRRHLVTTPRLSGLMRASKILIDCDMFRHWENFEPMGKIMQEERRKEAMKKLRNNEHLAKAEKKENADAKGDKHKHKQSSEDEKEETLSEDEAKLLHRNN
jgi:hypothetical protein